MENRNLKPEKITKPIQLLGAWLAGLLSIDSCFLIAAANLGDGTWESRALVVASIINVPLFLVAVFLLQTRFRPELQEDSYYSTYLSSKTNQLVKVSKSDAHFAEIRQQIGELEKMLEEKSQGDSIQTREAPSPQIANLTFGVNQHLEDSAEIEQRLRDIEVIAITNFGSREPPPGRNVSISEYLSNDDARQIIRLARELGFVTYNYFNNRAEDADEDVLLGSYGEAGLKL